MPRERSLLRLDGGWHNATTSIARSIVGGRCSALVHLDRVRDYAGVAHKSRLTQWVNLLEGTGIDPLRDVERAFVTAKTTSDTSGSAIVLDLVADRVNATLRILADRGERTGDDSAPVAHSRFYGEDYVLTLFGRSLIAIPTSESERLVELKDCRELPAPIGDEALSVFAEEPAVTLESTVDWPEDLVALRADIRLSRWGAVIDFVAQSTSATQARLDAETLEMVMNDLLKIDLVVFQLPLHDRVKFTSHGDQVEMRARFSRAELEVLAALGSL